MGLKWIEGGWRVALNLTSVSVAVKGSTCTLPAAAPPCRTSASSITSTVWWPLRPLRNFPPEPVRLDSSDYIQSLRLKYSKYSMAQISIFPNVSLFVRCAIHTRGSRSNLKCIVFKHFVHPPLYTRTFTTFEPDNTDTLLI